MRTYWNIIVGGEVNAIRWAMALGCRKEALRRAAALPCLGEHRSRIQRAWSAVINPDFFEDIGLDPVAIIADGYAAISERWGV